VCREVTRGAGGVAVLWLRVNPHGSSGAARGERRGGGSGRHGPNVGRPRPSRRPRSDYGAANRKEKLRSEGDGQA
jgi:hypothetical protein